MKSILWLLVESIKEYELECGNRICFSERSSEEFVDIFLGELTDGIESPWLNVNNLMPDQGEDILLLTTEGVIQGYYKGYYKGNNQWELISLDYQGYAYCGGDPIEVTHWMPLPQPPEEGK
jgi:hypothetical protein